MTNDETLKEIVEELCNLLETSPLRLMHPEVNESAQELADMIEEIGHPIAAERLRTGWDVLREQFRKSLQNVRAGSKDDAFEAPKQSVMGLPACIRCRKGVPDYDKVKGPLEWMFCSECRALSDGPELVPVLEPVVREWESSITRMADNLAYLKARLERCRG